MQNCVSPVENNQKFTAEIAVFRFLCEYTEMSFLKGYVPILCIVTAGLMLMHKGQFCCIIC